MCPEQVKSLLPGVQQSFAHNPKVAGSNPADNTLPPPPRKPRSDAMSDLGFVVQTAVESKNVPTMYQDSRALPLVVGGALRA